MSGEFVAAMEDVLALYALPYDARYPTVCLDEKPVVLHAEVRPGLPPAPGHVERRDYEYERHGTANLFVLVEPLAGWRHVCVTAAPHQAGLRRGAALSGRGALPGGRVHLRGAGQPQHPHGRRTLRDLPPQSRPVASWPAWSSITPPSTAAGSIRPRSRSASSSAAASPAPFRTPRPYSNGCRPWRPSATSGARPSTGNSPRDRPVSSSRNSTRLSQPNWTEY